MTVLVIAVTVATTIAALFGLWRTWRHGYVAGFAAGRIEGIDLLAESIANDLPTD